jgi:hypothetical protein
LEYVIGLVVGVIAGWVCKSRLVAPVLARRRGIDLVAEDLRRTNSRLEEQARELRQEVSRAQVRADGGTGA